MTIGQRYLCGPMPIDADPVGVALSGGGVRAACLGLGSLQVLEEQDVLGRARHVAAVSGGSYIAAAFMAARSIEGGSEARRPVEERPWSRCSPEELHLKRNLHYLADNLNDLLLGAAVYLLGLILNLVPFAAAMTAAGVGLGWSYRSSGFLEVTADGVQPGRPGLRLVAIGTLILAGAGYEYVRSTPDRGRANRSAYIVVSASALLLVPDAVAALVAKRPAGVDWQLGIVQSALLLGLALVLTRVMLATQWSAAVRRFDRVVRSVARLILAAAVVAAVSLPFLYCCALGADLAWWPATATLALSGLVLAFAGLFVHANNTSLHYLYATRLDRAYVVRAGSDTRTAVHLSELTLHDLPPAPGTPELVVCSAVNLRARESALGESCGPFVFCHSMVGSSLLADEDHDGYVASDELFGKATAQARKSLATLIAASGGAIAPNMGRYSSLGTRLIMVILNLRLGYWIRNPVNGHGRRSNGTLARGWHEPGPLGSFREALGNLSIHHHYLFVSDGGHWDNSGVLELLRRRCSTIFFCDAAGDAGRLGNLLRLISLARSELGVEFDSTERLLNDTAPVVRLNFRYPDDPDDVYGRSLLVMRTFMSPEMPADLIALSRTSSRFPQHSTLNQFLSSRDVDAYVSLGRWLAREAVRRADLPAQQPAELRLPPVRRGTVHRAG